MKIGSPEHLKAAGTAVANAAVALSTLAQLNGLIVTIETKPLEPLAMGNYSIEIQIRPSHAAYRGEYRGEL